MKKLYKKGNEQIFGTIVKWILLLLFLIVVIVLFYMIYKKGFSLGELL